MCACGRRREGPLLGLCNHFPVPMAPCAGRAQLQALSDTQEFGRRREGSCSSSTSLSKSLWLPVLTVSNCKPCPMCRYSKGGEKAPARPLQAFQIHVVPCDDCVQLQALSGVQVFWEKKRRFLLGLGQPFPIPVADCVKLQALSDAQVFERSRDNSCSASANLSKSLWLPELTVSNCKPCPVHKHSGEAEKAHDRPLPTFPNPCGSLC